MRSDMDHTVLPANYTMPAFTPQLHIKYKHVASYIPTSNSDESRPATLQTTTDDGRHQRAKQYWPIRWASNKLYIKIVN